MDETEIHTARRLNFIALVDKYPTQLAAAKAIDMNSGQVSHIVTGRKPMGDRLARKIEEKLGLKFGDMSKPSISHDGFMSVSHPDEQDVGILQYKDIRMSAGPGHENAGYSELDKITFKSSYIDKKGLEPDMCFCCYADGESMAPSINSGDLVLVNRLGASPIKSGKIYALNNGDECRLKRLVTLTTGGIRIISDNPDKSLYADEVITGDDLNHLQIIGIVVWSGGDK